jgi:hypothetical protein
MLNQGGKAILPTNIKKFQIKKREQFKMEEPDEKMSGLPPQFNFNKNDDVVESLVDDDLNNAKLNKFGRPPMGNNAGGIPTGLVGPNKIIKTGVKQLGPQMMRDKPKILNNSRTE